MRSAQLAICKSFEPLSCCRQAQSLGLSIPASCFHNVRAYEIPFYSGLCRLYSSARKTTEGDLGRSRRHDAPLHAPARWRARGAK